MPSARGRRVARGAIEEVLERYRRAGQAAGLVAEPKGEPVVIIVGSKGESPND